MSSLSNKKEILQTIIRKKVIIENNYFNISNIIEEIIANAEDDKTIKIAQDRQQALDNAINFAISELEALIQNFINSIQSNDTEKFKEIERQMQEKIDELNLKTRELTEDLNKANIINEYSHVPSNSEYYGSFDKAVEKDVEKVFGKKSRNEIKDMREGVLIESLNDPSPRELSIFDDMYFDEVASYNEYKTNKDSVNNAVSIKNEFRGMEEYSIDQQLIEIEKRLMDEINSLKTSNQILSDSNDTLISKINKKNNDILNTTLIDSGSFNMLDVAINDMISKIELAQLPDYRNQNIKNLEDISQSLVKSLESNLESLSKDVIELKSENNEYRTKIDGYIETINNLKNESMMKEQELNESYTAWVSSNKKLQDLELLLGQQSVDLSDLDGQKNVIIDSLEKKLRETINNLNNVLVQNEELILKQEELQEFIRVNQIKSDYTASAFENDIEARSLQDLVESEANRIVESKLSAMLSRYKDELEFLENKIKENIKGANSQKDLLTNEFEKEFENKSEIKLFEEKIKKFENKINKLENKMEQAQINDAKTRETIANLNELLDYDQIKEDVMDSEVGQKLKSLERMISETAYRLDAERLGVKPYENQEINKKDLSPSELEKLVTNSDLYNSVRAEIVRLEDQVSSLKSENIKIRKENFDINSELDDSIQKFIYNNNKMKEVEDLLNHQMYELEKLSTEKDELIYALEEKVMENSKSNQEIIDEIKSYEEELHSVDKWDEDNVDDSKNNEFAIRENIELLIDKRVNELLADKALGILSKQINGEVIQFKNNDPSKNIYDVENLNENIFTQRHSTPIIEDEYDDLPISQSFGSKDFVEEEKYKKPISLKVENDYTPSIIENSNINNEFVKEQELNENILTNQTGNTNKEKESQLIYELEKLQKEYELLQTQLIQAETKEKTIIKEVIKDKAKLPDELLENTEKLKNFERLLIQIDNEISNLENDSLNKFINNQI